MNGSGTWMQSLAQHFARVRRDHPNDRLLLVFDLDSTVIDRTHATRHLLLDYDRVHGTDHFHGLEVVELDGHANDLERVLAGRGLPASVRRDVYRWCLRPRSRPDAVSAVDRAHPGVLEVIRWFQLQPCTFVGFTSCRPARLREDTLRSVNRLGRELRTVFDAGLLRMNGGNDAASVIDSRVEALRSFAQAGYRTVAVVDSDPAVIEVLARADDSGDVLFLHFSNQAAAALVAPHTAAGRHFDLTALIGERDLPVGVTLVWHGVNDEDNLHQFLASQVSWAECDVRRDPRSRLVLRHDSFEATPWTRDERLLPLATALDALANHDRSIKLDLKDGPAILPELVALLDERRLPDDRLWFNAHIDVLAADGFQRVRSMYPEAIVQCPVDFLGPLVLAAPEQARAVLRMLGSWGINRFSVGWSGDHTAPLLERLREWDHPVNLYGVPDHESLLRAVLLLPSSVTVDFNFPDWNYFGRGSGERQRYHRYVARGGATATLDASPIMRS